MCVILDTNSVSEVLGQEKSTPGADFFNWIMKGGIKLVVGKTLLGELSRGSRFRNWYSNAFRTGKAVRISSKDDDEAEKRCKQLLQQGKCKSNDQHIIALAQISGARLLYTHDDKLKPDFKDFAKGRIYPLGESDNAKSKRRRIHQEKNLCARYDKRG